MIGTRCFKFPTQALVLIMYFLFHLKYFRLDVFGQSLVFFTLFVVVVDVSGVDVEGSGFLYSSSVRWQLEHILCVIWTFHFSNIFMHHLLRVS